MIVRAPNILPRLTLAAAAILTAAVSFTIVFMAGIHAVNATVSWAPQPADVEHRQPDPDPCPPGTWRVTDPYGNSMCAGGFQ